MKASRKGPCDVPILSITALLLPAFTEWPNSTENGLVKDYFFPTILLSCNLGIASVIPCKLVTKFEVTQTRQDLRAMWKEP